MIEDVRLDLRTLSTEQIIALTAEAAYTVKRSSILYYTVSAFTEMLSDEKYQFDPTYMHRHVAGKVHCNFGGSIIRKVLGPDYNCHATEFLILPWARFVVVANMFSYNDVRSTFNRINDKLYNKFFKSSGWEPYDLRGDIQTQLPILLDLANHLEEKGF